MLESQSAIQSTTSAQGAQFVCHPPDAQRVFLTATFNDWNPNATPMSKGDDGKWTVGLELPHGCYEFKFVVDGEWCCEANCRTDSECP